MRVANLSYWLAVLAILLLIAWLSSGSVSRAIPSMAARSDAATVTLPRVAYRALTAERIAHVVRVEGQIEAHKAITIKARLDSVVKTVRVQDGDRIAGGTLLLELDAEDLPARIKAVSAGIELARSELAAARSLSDRGLASDIARKERVANLSTAESQLVTLETQLAHTVIKAPFGGVAEQVLAEPGESVKNGDMLLRLIKDESLIMVGQIPQQHVHAMQPGLKVHGRLLSGREIEGRLSFVSSEADPATRTYRVEALFSNPERLKLAGSTVTLSIQLGTVEAHRISPAHLTLDRQGQLSIQHLADDDTIVETPVARVQATNEAIWVSGLPSTIRMVTLGKGFAPVGSRVAAYEESAVLSRADP